MENEMMKEIGDERSRCQTPKVTNTIPNKRGSKKERTEHMNYQLSSV